VARPAMNIADRDLWQARGRLPRFWGLLNQPAIGVFVRRNDYGCGDAITRFHMQQANALRAAAGFADSARIHADDFAILADQHDFGFFRDLSDAGYFAVAFGGLDVDHA